MDFIVVCYLASRLRRGSDQGRIAMYTDLLTLVFIIVTIPVIAFVIFISVAKPKRRRRNVQNFR